MSKHFRIGFITGLIAFAGATGEAKVFRNAYVSFNLPDKWDCAMETTEWVCRSQVAQTAKEAIIILTAKERGPTDEMGAYEGHLKASKAINNRLGKSIQSKVIDVKPRQINGQNWILGLHLGSEVPDYYTRYAATVKDNLGILVTFSAHQMVYTKYSNDFFNAILSLRVVADKNALGGNRGGMLPAGSDLLGPGQMMGFANMGDDVPAEQNSHSNLTTLLALVVLIAAVAGYLFWKQQNKKKRKPRR